MTDVRFGTAISCIDGRIQRRVLDQLELRFGVRNIDTITAPGAVKFLVGEQGDEGRMLLSSALVSAIAHESTDIAVIAHSECAGNPVPDSVQKEQLTTARRILTEAFPEAEILALFLDLKTGFSKV